MRGLAYAQRRGLDVRLFPFDCVSRSFNLFRGRFDSGSVSGDRIIRGVVGRLDVLAGTTARFFAREGLSPRRGAGSRIGSSKCNRKQAAGPATERSCIGKNWEMGLAVLLQ